MAYLDATQDLPEARGPAEELSGLSRAPSVGLPGLSRAPIKGLNALFMAPGWLQVEAHVQWYGDG